MQGAASERGRRTRTVSERAQPRFSAVSISSGSSVSILKWGLFASKGSDGSWIGQCEGRVPRRARQPAIVKLERILWATSCSFAKRTFAFWNNDLVPVWSTVALYRYFC